MKSDFMSQIHLNGRHHKITLISTTQYCMTCGPMIRTNIDYVFAFYDNNVSNRKKLYENFFGVFSSFSQFDSTFKGLCSQYTCMVLDNTNKQNHLESSIYWYKASPEIPSSFRVMRKRYYYMEEYLRKLREKEQEKEVDATETKTIVTRP